MGGTCATWATVTRTCARGTSTAPCRRFRFDPRAPAGPTLTRDLGDGRIKTAYVADPTPRAYDDFAPMVRSHYTQAGFGPFLSGLRAVSIQPDAVLTLRDAEYARDTRFGRSVRRVLGRDAVTALLVERFGLPERLVDEAVAVARRRVESRQVVCEGS